MSQPVDRLLVADADPALRARAAAALTFPGREVVQVEPREVPARLDAARWEGLVLGWGSGPGEAYAMALATGLPDADRPAVVLLARDVAGPALRAAFSAGATDVVGVRDGRFDERHLAAVVLAALDEVLLARPGHVPPEPEPEPVEVRTRPVAPAAPVPEVEPPTSSAPPPSLSSLVARLREETAPGASPAPPRPDQEGTP